MKSSCLILVTFSAIACIMGQDCGPHGPCFNSNLRCCYDTSMPVASQCYDPTFNTCCGDRFGVWLCNHLYSLKAYCGVSYHGQCLYPRADEARANQDVKKDPHLRSNAIGGGDMNDPSMSNRKVWRGSDASVDWEKDGNSYKIRFFQGTRLLKTFSTSEIAKNAGTIQYEDVKLHVDTTRGYMMVTFENLGRNQDIYYLAFLRYITGGELIFGGDIGDNLCRFGCGCRGLSKNFGMIKNRVEIVFGVGSGEPCKIIYEATKNGFIRTQALASVPK